MLYLKAKGNQSDIFTNRYPNAEVGFMRSDESKDVSISIIESLLNDTGFSGFEFGTSFSLRFDRNTPAKLQGAELPWRVELRLDTEWGFGEQSDWEKRIVDEGASDSPSPEEPLQAFELTRLRWSEGSNVSTVKFNETKLTICFENGKEIYALSDDDESSWDIVEYGIHESEAQWIVTFENGTLSTKMPASISSTTQ